MDSRTHILQQDGANNTQNKAKIENDSKPVRFEIYIDKNL